MEENLVLVFELTCICGRKHTILNVDEKHSCACGCEVWVRYCYGDYLQPWVTIPDHHIFQQSNKRKFRSPKLYGFWAEPSE